MKFALTLILFLSGNFAQAIAPQWKYRVYQTPHFEIIYRDSQKDLAKRYAIASEQAYELLMPIFKEGPSKTIVVLKDDTDAANGLANFLPYAHIVIYPVLPNAIDSIEDYGDWPLEIMIHEYTHILNMYPAHGIYWPLKYLLGSVVRPNAIMPTWYLEGLAVSMESRLSTHGRLRSSETRAQARAFTLGQNWNLEDIARINESALSDWPFGGRPYVFGAWWWDKMQRDAGEEKGYSTIYNLNQRFSRRLPFLLNAPIRDQTGKSAAELLDATYQDLNTKAQKELQALNKSGPHQSIDVTKDSSEQNTFAISPSGQKLVYWSGVYKKGNEAKLKVRESPQQPFLEIDSQRLFKAVGTLRVQWLNENEFLFDQANTKHPYMTYRDLYTFNLETETKTRLTTDARAQDATASPSGNFIAFIQNDGGRTRLMLLTRADSKIKSLVSTSLAQRLGSPEFLNEQTLLFTLRQQSGKQRIYSFDLASGKIAVWNEILTSPEALTRTPMGILVTDAKSGVRNAYLATSQSAQALSNTLTDIQRADYDPQTKNLIVSEMTPQGRRLKTFSAQNRQPAQLGAEVIPAPPKRPTPKFKLREESYLPIRYLAPRYLIPFIYQVEEGYIFQGITDMADPVGRNKYSLLGAYDSITKKASYGIDYVNHSTPVDIGLGYAKTQSYLGASGVTIEMDSARVNFATHWPWQSRFQKAGVGGFWSQSQGLLNIRRLGPTASYRFSNIGHPLNEWFGWNLGLEHEQFLEQSGYASYGHSTLSLGAVMDIWRGHKVSLQTRAAVAPDMQPTYIVDLGDRSVGGNYLINLAHSEFLLRGYPSGTFVGRKMVNANFEYIFGSQSVDRGLGLFPLFFRDLELALFADALAADGGGKQPELRGYTRTKLSEFYMGTGAELRLNTSMAYHLPVSFTVGLYYGLNDRFGGGFTPFLGIGAGTLGPLENKTP